ncbi:MAG: hypothetical protein AAGK77_14615 [Pseudomonadota bacterium]
MRTFTKRLYRERRRLAVVAVATFLAGAIAFWRHGGAVLGLPFWIVAGLAFMVCLTLALMGVVVLFPKVRHTAEAIALSIPCLSLMGAFSNELGAGVSSLTLIWSLLLGYLFFLVYASAWLDAYIPQRPKHVKSVAISKLPPDAIWPYLTVTPDTFDTFGGASTLRMDWIEKGVSFIETERVDGLATVDEVHTIRATDAPNRYAFDFHVPDATEDAPVSAGTYEFRLIPFRGGTKLETTRAFDRVTFRAQVIMWLDDGAGRLDDDKILNAELAERDRAAAA